MPNKLAPIRPSTSGYTDCACRDCFDITVSSDVSKPELCSDCAEAGCECHDEETRGVDCKRDDAYGCSDADLIAAGG